VVACEAVSHVTTPLADTWALFYVVQVSILVLPADKFPEKCFFLLPNFPISMVT
jgi:hypothetical protein